MSELGKFVQSAMDTLNDIAFSRKKFEEKAFKKRFMMSIRRVDDSKGFPLRSIDCPTQEEFLKRDAEGYYVDQTLNAMWWAWCEGCANVGEEEL